MNEKESDADRLERMLRETGRAQFETFDIDRTVVIPNHTVVDRCILRILGLRGEAPWIDCTQGGVVSGCYIHPEPGFDREAAERWIRRGHAPYRSNPDGTLTAL